MKEEEIYLLKILKGFVHNKNPGPFHGDWRKLISLADIHAVTGILGYMVMSYPDESGALAAELLKKRCFQTILLFSQRAESMKRLIRQMEKEGIRHLLLKGYIIKDYYPVPELRTYGDIDFLILKEDREKSDALMEKEGFERKTDWEPVYSYLRGREYYEIHTDVMEVNVSDKADYRNYFRHIWEHAHLTGAYTWELSAEYHFLYLLTHIAKHISGSGAGVRMYLDIAFFIRHFGKELDWEAVQRELSLLKLSDFANMALFVVWECFGVESPIPLKQPDRRVFKDYMEFTMAGGVFGYAGRDAGLIHLKKQDRNQETVSRIGTFCHRLFPSADRLEKRYPYLHKKPWLLPAAWIHRLYLTRKDWKKHAKEAKSIMNADTEEVLRLKRIYKEIGL